MCHQFDVNAVLIKVRCSGETHPGVADLDKRGGICENDGGTLSDGLVVSPSPPTAREKTMMESAVEISWRSWRR